MWTDRLREVVFRVGSAGFLAPLFSLILMLLILFCWITYGHSPTLFGFLIFLFLKLALFIVLWASWSHPLFSVSVETVWSCALRFLFRSLAQLLASWLLIISKSVVISWSLFSFQVHFLLVPYCFNYYSFNIYFHIWKGKISLIS